MANFEISMEKTARYEGTYSNNVNDLGGETKYGITWKTAKDHGYNDVSKLTIEQAKKIYKKDFWDINNFDLLDNQEVANNLFDFGVNSGVSRAIKYAQTILTKNFGLDMVIDGKCGKQTVNAINTICKNDDYAKLFIYRYKFDRIKLLTGIKSFNTFGKGWTIRALEV